MLPENKQEINKNNLIREYKNSTLQPGKETIKLSDTTRLFGVFPRKAKGLTNKTINILQRQLK